MTTRFSLYKDIHKGIRVLLSNLSLQAGRVDFSNATELSSFFDETRKAFAFLSLHAEVEERFVEPALEKAAPEVANILSRAHEEQEGRLDTFLLTLQSIDPDAADAAARGHRLVLQLSRLVGDFLLHMADEEEVAMPALWEALAESEILSIHHALMAAIPPDSLTMGLGLILPAVNAPERLALLSGVRAGAPQPAFEKIRTLARSVLLPEDDRQLEEGLQASLQSVSH